MALTPSWSGRNSVRRRWIQLGFLAVFVALPLFDLFRFDFPAERMYFFGAEVWLDEWALLWLALMFGMWLIGAASLLFGRVYCAYACPQMVFTELAEDLDAIGRRLARRFKPPARDRLARAASLAGAALLSVLTSVLFMGYFAPLGVVLRRLVALDFGFWVGLVGASTALTTFLDLVFLREKFCQSVCPYGLLQGILEDGRSLHVAYDQSSGPCIECKACVRVCPMEIDIRNGPFQIECTRCGSCIDACDSVLSRMKRPGLLSFRLPPFWKGGVDAKRALVAVSTLGFGIAMVVAVATRQSFAIQLSSVYAESGSAVAGTSEARALLRATNRAHQPATIAVRLEGLPSSAVVGGLSDGVVPPGAERRFELVVRVPAADLGAEASVTPFAWVVEGPERTERFSAGLLTHRRKST